MGQPVFNPTTEAARLAALERYDILDTPSEPAFERITQLAAKLFGVPVALTGFIDETRHWFKARVGTELSENPRAESFCNRTIAQADVLVVPDALEDERFFALPVVRAGLVRFYAGAPLITPGGQAVGTLCLLGPDPKHDLTREALEVLGHLAGLVVDELELRRITRDALQAEAALAASEGQLRAIIEHAVDTIFVKDLEGRYALMNPQGLRLAGLAADEVIGRSDAELFNDEGAASLLANDLQVIRTGEPRSFEERLVIAGETHLMASNKVPFRGAGGRILGVVGIARDVTAQKRAERELAQRHSLLQATLDATTDAILSVDLAGTVTGYNTQYLRMWQVPDALIAAKADETLLTHARSQLCDTRTFDARVEELRRDGACVTHDVFELKDGRVIERQSLPQRMSEEIVGRVWSFRDVTERRRAETRLTRLNEDLEQRVAERTHLLTEANRRLHELNEQQLRNAFYDERTGLPNRALLLDRLAQALERRRQDEQTFAVLQLNIDRFRHINTGLGREVGDALLEGVAARLSRCLRPADTLARLGGDEFVLLAEGLRGPLDAETLAQRVMDAFLSPFILGEHEVHVTVSIGFALNDPSYLSPEDLLRDADIALARARVLGKGRFEPFSVALRTRADARRSLEADLWRALERNEFAVHYQPIVALQDERLVGFEALLRWQHPQHGLVSPAEFIPVAEETGLITELDRWVLEEAVQQVASWRHAFGLPLSVNVNICGQQFDRNDLPDCVAQALAQSSLPARDLKLELTESVLLGDTSEVSRQLRAIKELGAQLYIDDFGTGYSSLSYLQRLPIDTLKIDRSFVSRMQATPESLALVSSMLAMANSLKLATVAEGIETEEQLLALRRLGCHYGQGYLFGRPLQAQAAEAFIGQSQLACAV